MPTDTGSPALKLWVYIGWFAPVFQRSALWPLAKAGSLSGGRLKSCGKPPSQLKPGVTPRSEEKKRAVEVKPVDGALALLPPNPPVGK